MGSINDRGKNAWVLSTKAGGVMSDGDNCSLNGNDDRFGPVGHFKLLGLRPEMAVAIRRRHPSLRRSAASFRCGGYSSQSLCCGRSAAIVRLAPGGSYEPSAEHSEFEPRLYLATVLDACSLQLICDPGEALR